MSHHHRDLLDRYAFEGEVGCEGAAPSVCGYELVLVSPSVASGKEHLCCGVDAARLAHFAYVGVVCRYGECLRLAWRGAFEVLP